MPYLKHTTSFMLMTLLSLMTLGACGTSTIGTTNPARTSTPSGTANSLNQVDWNNFTLPAACYSDSGAPVTMHNGKGDDAGLVVTLKVPVYKSIIGTSSTEAIIPYDCAGADAQNEYVAVFTGTADHVVFMGGLPKNDDPAPPIGKTFPLTVTVNSAAHTVILSSIAYSSSDSRCCPSLTVTNTYSWDGKQWQLQHHDKQPFSLGTPTATPGPNAHTLAYAYHVTLTGPENLTGDSSLTFTVAAANSCHNPVINPLDGIVVQGTKIHALEGDAEGTDSIFSSVGGFALGITDGAQFIIDTAIGKDIYAPTQAVQGTMTIKADGSGSDTFAGWENAGGNTESGEIDWTCAG